MQDKQTGEMVPMPDDYSEKLITHEYKKIKDRVLPRNRQGPVFEVGEEIIIKGGRFKIRSIGKQGLVLHGLPGTKFQKK